MRGLLSCEDFQRPGLGAKFGSAKNSPVVLRDPLTSVRGAIYLWESLSQAGRPGLREGGRLVYLPALLNVEECVDRKQAAPLIRKIDLQKEV